MRCVSTPSSCAPSHPPSVPLRNDAGRVGAGEHSAATRTTGKKKHKKKKRVRHMRFTTASALQRWCSSGAQAPITGNGIRSGRSQDQRREVPFSSQSLPMATLFSRRHVRLPAFARFLFLFRLSTFVRLHVRFSVELNCRPAAQGEPTAADRIRTYLGTVPR
jgi:hypothetical protein